MVLGLFRFSIPSLVSFGKLKFFEGISPFPQSFHTTWNNIHDSLFIFLTSAASVIISLFFILVIGTFFSLILLKIYWFNILFKEPAFGCLYSIFVFSFIIYTLLFPFFYFLKGFIVVFSFLTSCITT